MDKMEYKPTNHPYYCEMSNYDSMDEPQNYATWDDFLQEYKDADKDYNFIFRFDILESEQLFNRHPDGYKEGATELVDGDLELHLYVMQQRRGKYVPILVERLEKKDMQSVCDFLKGYYDYIRKVWDEFSS